MFPFYGEKGKEKGTLKKGLLLKKKGRKANCCTQKGSEVRDPRSVNSLGKGQGHNTLRGEKKRKEFILTGVQGRPEKEVSWEKKNFPSYFSGKREDKPFPELNLKKHVFKKRRMNIHLFSARREEKGTFLLERGEEGLIPFSAKNALDVLPFLFPS